MWLRLKLKRFGFIFIFVGAAVCELKFEFGGVHLFEKMTVTAVTSNYVIIC